MAHAVNKNKAPDLTTLAGRLAHCVHKAGGKRKLAASAILSEAQLFRYLHGLSDIPSERLITIAHAAEVDAGWLLTGAEPGSVIAPAAQRPPFRPALMQYVARMLDEFLVEYQRSFSPRVKSQLLTLIYEALRHEEVISDNENFPNKFQILEILTFMEALKTEEQVELYHKAMNILEYENEPLSRHEHLLETFCTLIRRGYESYYNSFVGASYYDRMGISILPETEIQLHQWIGLAFKTLKKTDLKVLDIGCGNGRHLAFMHKHYPKLALAGVETSSHAIELCKKMELRGVLPSNCVKSGESTDLPFETGSMDLVHSRYVLHYLPYFPGTSLGLDAAWQEMRRVLAPHGLMLITIPSGHKRNYGVFSQYLTDEEINVLLHRHGFKLIAKKVEDFAPVTTDKTVRACMHPSEFSISLVLQKI